MKIKVTLKKYCNKEEFEWHFHNVEDIYFLDESIEIKYIEDDEDKKQDIYTSIGIPKKSIKEIKIYDF